MFRGFLILKLKVMNTYWKSLAIGGVTQVFFGIFRIIVVLTFSKNDANMIWFVPKYIWMTQIFFGLIPWNMLEDFYMIKSGQISYELVRPITLYSLWMKKTLATRIAGIIIPMVLVTFISSSVLFLFNMTEYMLTFPTWIFFLLFLLSIAVSFILSAEITVFFNAITLYTVDASGSVGIFNTLSYFLSGMVIPLSLFPTVLQGFFIFQPYKGVIDTPAMIFSQQYTIRESLYFIGLQVMWVLILYVLNTKLIASGIKKLVIQGG